MKAAVLFGNFLLARDSVAQATLDHAQVMKKTLKETAKSLEALVQGHRQLAVLGISICSLLLARTSGQQGCVPSKADHQGVHAPALTCVACANEVQWESRGQQRRQVAKRR